MSWKLVVVMMSFSDTGAASTSLATIPDIRQEQACRALEAELSTDHPSEQLGHKFVTKSKATCVEDAPPAPPAPRARATLPSPGAGTATRAPQVERYEPGADRYDPYRDRYLRRGAGQPGQFDE